MAIPHHRKHFLIPYKRPLYRTAARPLLISVSGLSINKCNLSLNAPWQSKAALDVPSFHGSHGDLLIIIFHKLITNGHVRISSLYDCLLTIIVNISPYLKKLTMVTGKI